MPAFNFQKQFTPKVECGEKRQTIRAKRKDLHNPRVGDKLYLYTGMRTKSCRKLGEAICKSVQQITIYESGIVIDGHWLSSKEERIFSNHDGFNDTHEIFMFIDKKYGLPFERLLYKW